VSLKSWSGKSPIKVRKQPFLTLIAQAGGFTTSADLPRSLPLLDKALSHVVGGTITFQIKYIDSGESRAYLEAKGSIVPMDECQREVSAPPFLEVTDDILVATSQVKDTLADTATALKPLLESVNAFMGLMSEFAEVS
jgi:hypothetical protein